MAGWSFGPNHAAVLSFLLRPRSSAEVESSFDRKRGGGIGSETGSGIQGRHRSKALLLCQLSLLDRHNKAGSHYVLNVFLNMDTQKLVWFLSRASSENRQIGSNSTSITEVPTCASLKSRRYMRVSHRDCTEAPSG